MKKLVLTLACAALFGWAGLASAAPTQPQYFYKEYTYYNNEVIFNNGHVSETWLFDLDNDASITSPIDNSPVDINECDTILTAVLSITLLDYYDEGREEHIKLKFNRTADPNYSDLEIDEATATDLTPGLLLIDQDVLSYVIDEHTLLVKVQRISGNFRVSYVALGGSFSEGTCPNPVPEPATMLLFGTGLIGLAAAGRRKLTK